IEGLVMAAEIGSQAEMPGKHEAGRRTPAGGHVVQRSRAGNSRRCGGDVQPGVVKRIATKDFDLRCWIIVLGRCRRGSDREGYRNRSSEDDDTITERVHTTT